ncbi:MAG TPA: hypothetical protein VE244_00305 [Nitrososphaeraceae archaeon]|nr:hypothetical protein [Nitrososphaeraceae archaeon]
MIPIAQKSQKVFIMIKAILLIDLRQRVIDNTSSSTTTIITIDQVVF